MGNTLSSLNPTRKNACGIVVLLFLSASKTDAVLLHQSKTKLITLSEPAPESASSGGAGRGTTSSEAASSWSLQCMTGLTGATKDVRFSFAPDRQKHELDPQTATVGELAEELGMAESQYLVLSTSTGPAETLYPKQLDEDFHKELKSIWPQRRGVFGEGTIKDCFVIVSSENLAQYQTALDIYHRFPEFGWKEARGRIKDASPHHFQPGKELLLRILPLRPDEENLVRWVDYWMELYADDALKKDPKFMHEAIVASKGYAFHYASTELKHDKKLVLAAIAEASDDKRRHILGTALQKDPGLADDKCFMRDLIAVYPGALMQIVTSDLGLELKKDYDFMLSAVEESAHVLRKLPELTRDKDFMVKAVAKNAMAITYASPALQKDEEILRIAVKDQGRVLSAVESKPDPKVLEYLSPLTRDKDFMVKAVAKNAMAMKYASAELRKDPDVVLSAVKDEGRVLSAVNSEPEVLEYLSPLTQDKDFMKKAVAQNPLAIAYASLELQKDPDVVLSAVKDEGRVLSAVEHKPEVLKYLSPLTHDKDFMKKAVDENPLAIAHASVELYKNDWDLLFSAVKKNPRVIDVLPADAAELRLNPEFMEKLHSAVDEWWYRTQVHLRNINLHRQEP